ncbi:heme ABC transporter ATP-binding protein [Rhodoferax aquaticus]|uniref:Heme ABC transporter ATP-binding protein n=1 Tax=Rhodoferax aquaticus TaxID=2527691 RepID=A0A515ENG8_9BURK|nr:heme ABC transporter ATP-binding protein [Rhodoferax aquaticus]QDL54200.1 heme ABC transporter ATP-binding protein [Rhodoferax aquaticus]
MNAMLCLNQVSCNVGGAKLLEATTAAIAAGQVTAILGPNGAGKSTLLALLSGQRRASSGRVWLNGTLLDDMSPAATARVRALLHQDSSVAFDYTVRELVELGRYPHRLQPSAHEAGIVQAAMAATGVLHLQHRVVTALSGGERARAQLARVLAQLWEPTASGEPRCLLMDEPTAALDMAHQHQVLALAKDWAVRQGVGAVLVLHDLNLALRYADHVLLLQKGRLTHQGPPREVLTPAVVAEVWGVQAQAVAHADGVGQLLVSAA